jgi:phosphomannomutase
MRPWADCGGMPPTDALTDAALAWLAADPDPETRDELERLIERADRGDVGPLAGRFDGRLAFGTAGLRGEMGAGPQRMNRVVVRQAAAGLARWLGPGRSVVVGFDARHKSDEFARDSARVFAGAGLRVRLFPAPGPTPLLAYAVRELAADVGVMCTASHNPAHDNGYKVYLADGSQIRSPIDAEIAAAIELAAARSIVLAEPNDPLIEVVGAEVIESYLAHVVSLVEPGPRELRIVHTAMHGVGGTVALEALRRAGFTDCHAVALQAEPDPDFPTVAFPNPEEPGALNLAAALAVQVGADVVIANDPDADRLGVMVPVPNGMPGAPTEFATLTGDQIGALLAERVLATSTGDDRLVVTTFVSSRLLARMAGAEGVHHAEVPTGFKWVVQPGLDDPGLRFVFGYEEALGFSVDEFVRDKDGISAALRFVELVAAARAEGRTAWDLLEGLARRFGEHTTRTWWWRVDVADGQGPIVEAMASLRARPPVELGGIGVAAVTDLLAPHELRVPTDALVLSLVDGSRVCLRPSGTEPKLKVYVEVVEPVGDGADAAAVARAAGATRVDRLVAAMASRLAEVRSGRVTGLG